LQSAAKVLSAKSKNCGDKTTATRPSLTGASESPIAQVYYGVETPCTYIKVRKNALPGPFLIN